MITIKDHPGSLKPGDSVTYADLSLRHYGGTLHSIQRGPNGADCIVQWHTGKGCKAHECLRNLIDDSDEIAATLTPAEEGLAAAVNLFSLEG